MHSSVEIISIVLKRNTIERGLAFLENSRKREKSKIAIEEDLILSMMLSIYK